MHRRSRTRRFRGPAAIFIVSLVVCLGGSFIVPRILRALGSDAAYPVWLSVTLFLFGLVAVVTVPLAWRWLYWRYTDSDPDEDIGDDLNRRSK